MAEEKDRHLEAPGEANRDKHINFLAREQGDADSDLVDDAITHVFEYGNAVRQRYGTIMAPHL